MNGKNIAQIIEQIDEPKPLNMEQYREINDILEQCQFEHDSLDNNNPPKFINDEEEDEIIRQVEI